MPPDSNNIVNAFANGDMLNVGFTPFYEQEHKWMFKHNILRDYKAYKNQILHPLPNNVTLFLDTIYSSNIAQLDSVETLIGLENYPAAFNMNSICNPSWDYSNKLHEINHLLIPQWDSLAHNHQYIVNDAILIQSVIDIAELCLVEYGDAVLKARIFIHNHVDPCMEFVDPCELTFSGSEERALIDPTDLFEDPD